MTIGNFADAMLAAMGGGQFLGEGCDRKAWLVNGVVYKTPQSHHATYYQNREYQNMTTASPSVPWLRIPDIAQYDVNGIPINAMTYVNGTHRFDWDESLVSALGEINMEDTCEGNVLLDDNGTYWVVDFGE